MHGMMPLIGVPALLGILALAGKVVPPNLGKALAAAGVPISHFPVKRTYSVQDMRGAIFEQPEPERKA